MKNKIWIRFRAGILSAALWSSPYMVQSQPESSKLFTVKSATPDVALTKLFHEDPRWCGADGACTVPLDEFTTVWLFGDTFIKKNALVDLYLKHERKPPLASEFSFINNTAAVLSLNSGNVKFYWRDSHGSPAALMAPKIQNKSYYWPGDGFVLDKKLFIVNKVVVPCVVKKASDFPFEWKSDDLVQISNPGAKPTEWQWKTVALPEHQQKALMGTACLLRGDYAYFYTSLPKFKKGTNVHPTGVARISRNATLSMDMTKFEFWNGSNWLPDVTQSSVLFEDGTSEMTVTQLHGEPYLVATYMAPMSADISMRFSKKPEGPWSDAIKVFHCPEQQLKVLGRQNAVYSAKAHPELSQKSGEVVVSYCSNPGEMKHYLARPELYYPRIIRVDLRQTN